MVVGESTVLFLSCLVAPVFLLATCRSLTSFFPIESFKGFLQLYPRYFEGVPLGYQKFVLGVSCQTTRDVAESEMIDLSKLEVVEYP